MQACTSPASAISTFIRGVRPPALRIPAAGERAPHFTAATCASGDGHVTHLLDKIYLYRSKQGVKVSFRQSFIFLPWTLNMLREAAGNQILCLHNPQPLHDLTPWGGQIPTFGNAEKGTCIYMYICPIFAKSARTAFEEIPPCTCMSLHHDVITGNIYTKHPCRHQSTQSDTIYRSVQQIPPPLQIVRRKIKENHGAHPRVRAGITNWNRHNWSVNVQHIFPSLQKK